VGKLSRDEIYELLDTPRLPVRIGTVGADGWPSVVPIWYLRIDDVVYFSPRLRSEWRSHLEENGLATLCFDTYESVGRRVIVRAKPELRFEPGRDKEWRDIWWRMTLRYMPVERAIWYVTFTANEPRALYSVDLKSATVRSWQTRDTVETSDPSGVWAPGYYVSGKEPTA
jgi:nitroimidazol reductase NimA-like FMN-containing flavoprotein (pyridoxamine 5'-phosphate oxidase superfamily)